MAIEAVTEAYSAGYAPLPANIQAVTMRWQSQGARFERILYDASLRKLSLSAQRRHVAAHELAHIICSHTGDLLVMWRHGQAPTRFERHLDDCQERQCDHVAAYLLVPLSALRDLAGEEPGYIARVLDVPVELVGLRWEIYRKYGR